MRRLLVVSALVFATPAAMAQESLTKAQIINRSAGICRDLNRDVAPDLRRAENADTRREFIRAGRGFVRTSRPYIRDLADLEPADGGRGRRYRRYVANTTRAANTLSATLDALAARRFRLAERRALATAALAERAQRAGRRYGLRRSCIRYLR